MSFDAGESSGWWRSPRVGGAAFAPTGTRPPLAWFVVRCFLGIAAVVPAPGCGRWSPVEVELRSESLRSDVERAPELWWFESTGGDRSTLRRGRPGAASVAVLDEPHAEGVMPRGSVLARDQLCWAVLPSGRRHGDVARLRSMAESVPTDLADGLLWPQRAVSMGGRCFAIEGDPTPPATEESSAAQHSIDLRLVDASAPGEAIWTGRALWAQAHAVPRTWGVEAPLLLVIQPEGAELLVPGTGLRAALGVGIVRDVEVDSRRGVVRYLQVPDGMSVGAWMEVDLSSRSRPRLLRGAMPLDSSPRTDALGRLTVTEGEPHRGFGSVPEWVVAGQVVVRRLDGGPPRWEIGSPPQPVGSLGAAIELLGAQP